MYLVVNNPSNIGKETRYLESCTTSFGQCNQTRVCIIDQVRPTTGKDDFDEELTMNRS